MSIRSFATLLLLLTLGLVGCGGAHIAPVKGRVLCNSKPVTAALVIFAPVPASEKDREPGKSATGFTEADGTFVLSTYKELDGAQVGQHQVTVALEDTNPAPCKKRFEITLEVKPGQNDFNLELNQ